MLIKNHPLNEGESKRAFAALKKIASNIACLIIAIVILISSFCYIFPSLDGMGHYEGTIVKKWDGALNGKCFEIMEPGHIQSTWIGVRPDDYNKYEVGDYFNGTGRIDGWGWI